MALAFPTGCSAASPCACTSAKQGSIYNSFEDMVTVHRVCDVEIHGKFHSAIWDVLCLSCRAKKGPRKLLSGQSQKVGSVIASFIDSKVCIPEANCYLLTRSQHDNTSSIYWMHFTASQGRTMGHSINGMAD